jgi:hypothetical protein
VTASIGIFDSKPVSSARIETPKINVTGPVKAAEVTPGLSSPASLVTLSQSQSQPNDIYSRTGTSDNLYTPVTKESKVNLRSSISSVSDIQFSSQNQKQLQSYVDIQQSVDTAVLDQSEKTGTRISFLS